MPFITTETEHRIAEAVENCEANRLLIAHDPVTQAGVAVVVIVTEAGPQVASWTAAAPMSPHQLETFADNVLSGIGESLRAGIGDARPVTIN